MNFFHNEKKIFVENFNFPQIFHTFFWSMNSFSMVEYENIINSIFMKMWYTCFIAITAVCVVFAFYSRNRLKFFVNPREKQQWKINKNNINLKKFFIFFELTLNEMLRKGIKTSSYIRRNRLQVYKLHFYGLNNNDLLFSYFMF